MRNSIQLSFKPFKSTKLTLNWKLQSTLVVFMEKSEILTANRWFAGALNNPSLLSSWARKRERAGASQKWPLGRGRPAEKWTIYYLALPNEKRLHCRLQLMIFVKSQEQNRNAKHLNPLDECQGRAGGQQGVSHCWLDTCTSKQVDVFDSK